MAKLKVTLKLILLGIDWLVTLRLPGRKKTNKLAIVRLDAIGDFILWLDSAKEYRQLYPDQKITLIANSSWANLASRLRYWDDVWPVELNRFTCDPLYRWKTLIDIRNASFDTVIQPVFSRMLLYGDSIVRASQASQRVGSIGDLSCIHRSEKIISDRWYTHLVYVQSGAEMELDRNAEFMTNLSGINFSPNFPKLPILDKLPTNLQVLGEYFIVFPGASKAYKRWSAASFSELLRKLSQQCPWQAVLCGSSNEIDLCASVVNMSQVTILDFSGKTSLPELVELVRGAKLLVSNDTSAIHIANAVDTPSICILGGGHYGRFLPYSDHLLGLKPITVVNKMPCFNCNWNCTQPHDSNEALPCVASIGVETVLEQVKQQFGKYG